jgi:hypothetical protein
MPSAPPAVDASYAEKIKWLRGEPYDYTKDITEPASKSATDDIQTAVEELKVSELSEQEQVEAIKREFLYIGGLLPKRTTPNK